MNRIPRPIKAAAVAAIVAASPMSASARYHVDVHGSVQTDILFPEVDKAIGTPDSYEKKCLSNTYADATLSSEYFDAGLRFEFMKWPLPGYEPDFSGWGVPNIYVRGKYKGFELTAGDFYEQFGSGFILRTYQERSLGIDNSLRGGRLRVSAVPGLRLTVLGGVQRRYWDWRKHNQVYGADAEAQLHDWIKGVRDRGAIWTLGASYVLKHEDQGTPIEVPGTDYRLKMPSVVPAWDIRTNFLKNGWGAMAEFAWKGQDPSYDNKYTYGNGTALMLQANYSRKGFSALVQAKRSENMSYRSQRSIGGTSAFINNMPAFTYQHTYSLASMYPYATQTDGEWAFQGQVAYTFPRKTAMGGKYGTKLRLNLSYIRGLHRTGEPVGPVPGSVMGSNGYQTKFFGMGEGYYHDVNLQMEKRLTRDFTLTLMYMNQMSNRPVVEKEGEGKLRANIIVAEGKYKISKRFTLRGELQYMFTHQDRKDWAYGLLELSVNPWLMFTISDMWNCGGDGTMYYMGGVAGNYRNNRLQLSYGRTKKGYNCSGGVCREIPAYHGFQIAYTFNF